MVKVQQKTKTYNGISVRKKGNGFEARTTLEIDGFQSIPLSRYSSISDKEAIRRLQEAIVETYNRVNNQTEGYGNISKVRNIKNIDKYMNSGEKRKAIEKVNARNKFCNVTHEWLKDKQKQTDPNKSRHISPKTIDAYIYPLKNHLIPAFGETNIEDITQDMFQKYIDERTGSPKTIRDDYVVMNLIMKYAKKNKLIKENPIENTELPEKRKPEISYLTEERQEVWLDYMEQDGRQWVLLFATLLQTGMRPEEGCGLKWQCVDFDNEVIIVENAYKEKTIYDENFKPVDHIHEDGELKTLESYRKIPMRPRIKKILKDMKDKRIEELAISHRKLKKDDYVFLNIEGRPYVPERLSNKMPTFRKKYDLEHCTVYGLRHSFATLCSEKGVPDVVLKELMGHADSDTTKQYYIHISLDRKKREIQRLWE